MKKSILALSSMLLISHSYSWGSSANLQAITTLSASCTIAAQNLSFGSMGLPLSAQSASSNMNVLCSQNATYTIGLAYGGVYGQGQNVNESLTLAYTTSQKSYDVHPGTVNCWWSNTGSLTSYTYIYQQSFQSSCAATITHQFNSSYSYGKMIGVASGDNIAYSIQVPNKSGEVWNSGNYTYSAAGTGSAQTIPVTGTIVPAQSGSNYPTPDMYMDTVTAVINF